MIAIVVALLLTGDGGRWCGKMDDDAYNRLVCENKCAAAEQSCAAYCPNDVTQPPTCIHQECIRRTCDPPYQTCMQKCSKKK